MNTRSTLMGCAAALALGCVAAPALAQRAPPDVYQEAVPPPEPYETTNNRAIDRRLDRSEKALRELRSIVLKAQAQGTPVEVKPAGPDPILTDLQQRVSDLDATVRRLTGQVESLRFELNQTQRQAADAQTEARAVGERLQQMQAPPAPTPDASEAIPEESAAGPGAEAEAYAQARALYDQGDHTGAAEAMQVFIQRYPGSSRIPTAHYWMGRAYAARNENGPAAVSFAQSLKGWPQASWAADATAQLAASLVAVKRTGDACRALGEFDNRYAAKASVNVKTLADRARKAADCR